MINEFDKLAITSEEYKEMSETEINERVKKREELLKRMSRKEIEELLKRDYPVQFKQKLKKYL